MKTLCLCLLMGCSQLSPEDREAPAPVHIPVHTSPAPVPVPASPAHVPATTDITNARSAAIHEVWNISQRSPAAERGQIVVTCRAVTAMNAICTANYLQLPTLRMECENGPYPYNGGCVILGDANPPTDELTAWDRHFIPGLIVH